MKQHNSCNNQDHKNNNHAQDKRVYPEENPSQPREKPSNPLLYCQEKNLHTINPSAHKRVFYDQER
jgi:hypothetical protein